MRLTIAFTVDSVEFTAGVIDGSVSLGGSESACLGLARALVARGHDVHIFTTKIGADAPLIDHAGVAWHASSEYVGVSAVKDWDVLVALRQPMPLTAPVKARFRVLWNQDLMGHENMKSLIMGCAWAYDAVAYVSAFHRKQWEGVLPDLAPLGWVTKNGHDAGLAKATAGIRRANRIIHISRPERGVAPLLAMWPALRARVPDAELHIARYDSMYDAGGWGQVCKSFDARVAEVHASVGGITYLGELGKPALYQALAEAAVMWYPGVVDFAETSCIAAIEAQANGCLFVGSYKGALPETVPHGELVPGDAMSDTYQNASIEAVVRMLDGCRHQTVAYRGIQQAGRAHVQAYSYEVLAAEWEAWLLQSFQTRYAARKPEVLRSFLHHDDHETAKLIAAELGDAQTMAFCDRVAAGLEHTADDYATHAMDPVQELNDAKAHPENRHGHCLAAFEGRKRVLDLACGTGTFAMMLAMSDKTRTVVGVDFSSVNIEKAKALATQLGIADRCSFYVLPIWNMATQQPEPLPFDAEFDGVWAGEILEHIRDCSGFVDFAESFCAPGGTVAFSVPFGPMVEIAHPRLPWKPSHVHHFTPAQLEAVFSQKRDLRIKALFMTGQTRLGSFVGNWFLQYVKDPSRPTGRRDFDRRVLERPRPTLSVGILANQVTDIRKCLESVWAIADEIIIGDTGPLENRADLDVVLTEFPRKGRILTIGPVEALPGGFSEARNLTREAATGEYFLWIDTDEVLSGGQQLRKYIDSGPLYHGYIIRQHHLSLDQAPHFDRPTRLFKRVPEIAFYGCIHEQPQQDDCNGLIRPCMEVTDVGIAHTGYLTEAIRRDKCINRNLPLLKRDQQMFPDRTLGKLLVMRDYTNFALWESERTRGQLTEKGKHYRSQAIGIFERYFADPAHLYHALARPFYEACLEKVEGAIQVECGFAAKQQGLGDEHATAVRFWARTPEQARQWLDYRLTQTFKAAEPWVLDVEPMATVAPDPVEVPA
jgi:2-polyprenyl-3-methyl-5-hydroxy-6-metoxy-1,4-benzoquinol methylase/glycosyltransferase involved in cell wall biosynthesis